MAAPRRLYELTPPGPSGHLHRPTRLARAGGRLEGELQGDHVVVRLSSGDAGDTTLMLPGEYRARLEPFELLDENGAVVARGGDVVDVTGGFLPTDDPRGATEPSPVFFSGRVSTRASHQPERL